MSSKSVKFEISLKELTVKFEGDIQTAERMQGQITGALNSLASAQNRLLTSGAATNAPTPVVIPATGRRRRRRSSTASPGIDPSILDATAVVPESGDGAVAEDGVDAARRTRRSSGGNQTALITTLKTENFFSTRRTIGDIRGELGRKGHTFKSNEISPALVSLTKGCVLKRDQDPQTGKWVYYAE
jgi:hypothetical protein